MKFIKKCFVAILLVLATTLIVPATIPVFQNSYTVQAASIKINKTKKTLNVKQTYTLKITGSKKKVKWSSSNKKVATVNAKGKVTAKKKGTATITAKVNGKKYTCKIKVENPKISQTSKKIEQGSSFTLKITGTTQNIKWSSNNKKVATVNSKGKVTAKKKGTAKITAKVGNKTFTCKVTVKSVSKGKQNALARAKSYLKIFSFSKEGLIHQLKYDKFSDAEAKYAVENCGANWKSQAKEKAKDYLRAMPFSKEGLLAQLKYEKFTDAEAKYGVDHCGANWNEQAKLKAKEYLRLFSFSKDELINQLIFDKFTKAQAEYAAKAVGF